MKLALTVISRQVFLLNEIISVDKILKLWSEQVQNFPQENNKCKIFPS